MTRLRSTPRLPVLTLGLLAAAALAVSTARAGHAGPPPVHVVLFTHIEDNTPTGTLGTIQCRNNYLLYRQRLIELAVMARSHGIPWSLQPDHKFLRAALLYEDAATRATTGGMNLLAYLRDSLDVPIDPHSHERLGFNYTDVAHLLDSLGVGGSTVIGGHVWDPALPEFQEWDRYRAPVAGTAYDWASWRGDILMGSGTPNHVNDPIVSGVWRPRDRDHYFEHAPDSNIVAIGQYRGTLAGITELRQLQSNGTIPGDVLLTTSYHVRPGAIMAVGGIAALEDTVFRPLAALRDSGHAVATDFTSLVATWRTDFGEVGFLYDAEATSSAGDVPTAAGPGAPPVPVSVMAAPNPFSGGTVLHVDLAGAASLRIEAFDVLGRRAGTVFAGTLSAGRHALPWEAADWPSGVYLLRTTPIGGTAGASPAVPTRVVIAR